MKCKPSCFTMLALLLICALPLYCKTQSVGELYNYGLTGVENDVTVKMVQNDRSSKDEFMKEKSQVKRKTEKEEKYSNIGDKENSLSNMKDFREIPTKAELYYKDAFGIRKKMQDPAKRPFHVQNPYKYKVNLDKLSTDPGYDINNPEIKQRLAVLADSVGGLVRALVDYIYPRNKAQKSERAQKSESTFSKSKSSIYYYYPDYVYPYYPYVPGG